MDVVVPITQKQTNLKPGELSVGDVDRMVIAANLQSPDAAYIIGEDNPETTLCRYEFVEVMTRIADMKYVKSKILDTITSAMQMLINNSMNPFYKTEIEGTWGSLLWR